MQLIVDIHNMVFMNYFLLMIHLSDTFKTLKIAI